MNEQKPKKRTWVKDVAIVFLVILLVLTFFSKTIMDWSLPEVAVQTVTSGSISAQIRGSAAVKATETYEVKIDETRKVRTVYPRVGDAISAGDVLIVLSDESSEELKAAKQNLEAALESLESQRNSYQRALLQATTYDYVREDRAIAKQRAEIEKLQKERDALDLTDAKVTKAQADLDAAKAALGEAEEAVKAAQEQYDAKSSSIEDLQAKLAQLSPGGGNYSVVDSAYDAYLTAQQSVANAEAELNVAKLLYQTYYDKVVEAARAWILEDYKAAHPAPEPEEPAEGEEPEETPELTFDDLPADERAKLATYVAAYAERISGSDTETYAGYNAVVTAENAVDNAKESERRAYNAYSDALSAYYDENSDNGEYTKLSREIKDAQVELRTLAKSVEDAQKAQTEKAEAVQKTQTALSEAETELNSNKSSYESLNLQLASQQESLEDAIFNLTQQKNSDKISQQLQELNFQDMRRDIASAEKAVEEAQAQVDKYSGTGESGTEIVSEVNGILKTLNVSSGNRADANTVLATIEVPDRGYTAELSVSQEQAQRVNIGDTATVSTGWWGSRDISARLAAIRTDPQNPRTNRLLVFALTGADVESGSNVTLSIGERSRNYDTVIPKSALRSDSNGNYVLMVVAKASPVGNRYTATRIDVTVLAQDDNLVAVNGGLSYNDYVITSATTPVDNGMQVRMADK